jgi:serine/threonine protein kinase/tetratricopeptide (TPR) repeat protein
MIGQVVSHYKILNKLGGGGMGIVYEAEDCRLGRHVALKFLASELTQDQQSLLRFQQEARAASALNHSNICTIYDIDEFDGQPFLVMEFLEGQDLRTFIGHKPVNVTAIVDLSMQLTDALQAAHSKGIVHRDIKPANIFVTTQGKAKILDFGLAKLMEPATAETVTDSPFTRTQPSDLVLSSQGLAVGTVGYMSPEQARGEPLDGRSDLFSFGAILYEMATGRRAFTGNTVAVVFNSILNYQPPPMQEINPSIPWELGRIVAKTLEKDREARYQSASEVQEELERLKRDLSPDGGLSSSTSARKSGTLSKLTRTPRRTTTRRKIGSLAVLPFINENADPEMEYFSDGITESILDALTTLPKVRIMARNTVFQHKSKTVDPQSIGRRLNVEAVLIGRILLRDESLVVRAELVDVEDGARVWGGRYDRMVSDVFAVQEEISKEISEALRLKLTNDQKKRLTHRYTKQVAAYHLYLKGRYYWNKRTESGLTKAIEYFQKAVECDPAYAWAYAGLADCFPPLGAYRILAPGVAFARAKSAATKALELDAQLAEAHTALALSTMFYDWNWPKAEEEFTKAIQLNPNYPIGHQWYATYLMAMERPVESLASIQRAQELDPLSLAINTHVGWGFYFSRRYTEGGEQLRKTLELDTDFTLAHFVLGQIYTQTGLHSEAISELQRAAALSSRLPAVLAAMAYCHGLAGDKSRAEGLLSELGQVSAKRYVSPFDLALGHIGLGQKDQAFEWLQKGVEDRSSWLIWLKVEPVFDALRSDLRFPELVSRVGLPA